MIAKLLAAEKEQHYSMINEEALKNQCCGSRPKPLKPVDCFQDLSTHPGKSKPQEKSRTGTLRTLNTQSYTHRAGHEEL